MRTFERYLLHFGGICILIMLIFCVLFFADNSSMLQPIGILAMWICVLLFSVPMAALFSSWGKICIIKLKKELDDLDLKKLDDFIRNKYNRKCISETEGKKEYKMESRYKAWLTNSIIIEKNDDMYILKIPKVYANEINIEFSKYL